MAEGNVAGLALRHCARQPNRTALVIGGEAVSYGELGSLVARYAAGLRAHGLREGDRILLLFPPSVDFFALALAIAAVGMVTVMIDGGMDKRRIVAALRASRARALVSIDLLLRRRLFLPAVWRMQKFSIDSKRLGVRPLSALRGADDGIAVVSRRSTDPGMITFTSGSTGLPKGVDRTHGLLVAQHEAFADHLPLLPDDVDMPCFPVMALHNICLGVTTVMPPLDLRAPASVDPRRLLEAIRKHRVTSFDAPPAVIEKVVAHMEATGEGAPTIRRVVVGGAPVSRKLCRRILRCFPDSDARVVYGSTEAEPISGIAMHDVVASDGPGFLVGQPAQAAEVALVTLPNPVPAHGEIDRFRTNPGEVLVRGDHVNRRYVNNPDADHAYKLPSSDGRVWHRTGDIARQDEQGRLWLLGGRGDAIVHRGRTLHPLALEAQLLDVEGIHAAGLVSHGHAPEGELAVVLDDEKAMQAVRALLRSNGVDELPVRRVESLPMDARHNSKIDRAALRRLLEGKWTTRRRS